MRDRFPVRLEAGRDRKSEYATSEKHGGYGRFFVTGPCGAKICIVSSDGSRDQTGWEHVSVSTQRRPPNWTEMCFVKDLFWYETELVVQFHPPRSEYVNNHPHCLHLFKPKDGHIRLPPSIMVGLRDQQTVASGMAEADAVFTDEQEAAIKKGRISSPLKGPTPATAKCDGVDDDASMR